MLAVGAGVEVWVRGKVEVEIGVNVSNEVAVMVGPWVGVGVIVGV